MTVVCNSDIIFDIVSIGWSESPSIPCLTQFIIANLSETTESIFMKLETYIH